MEKVIKEFKNCVSENFIVGGSLALAIVGGFNIPVNDIDIEVESSDAETIKKLRMLSIAYPSDVKNYSKSSRIDFMFMNVKFNAFIVEKSNRTVVYRDYIKYSTVMEVIRHKKIFNRVKDLKSINLIATELLI